MCPVIEQVAIAAGRNVPGFLNSQAGSPGRWPADCVNSGMILAVSPGDSTGMARKSGSRLLL
jgi:hypothetical protein